MSRGRGRRHHLTEEEACATPGLGESVVAHLRRYEGEPVLMIEAPGGCIIVVPDPEAPTDPGG